MPDQSEKERLEKLTRDFAAGKLPQQQKAKSQAKPVPTVYKHIIKAEWFREFTFLERLGILFGSNLVVAIGIATQHSPGDKFQPLIIGKVSKETSPTEYMKSIVAGMLEEKQTKGGARVESEPEKPKAEGK